MGPESTARPTRSPGLPLNPYCVGSVMSDENKPRWGIPRSLGDKDEGGFGIPRNFNDLEPDGSEESGIPRKIPKSEQYPSEEPPHRWIFRLKKAADAPTTEAPACRLRIRKLPIPLVMETPRRSVKRGV